VADFAIESRLWAEGVGRIAGVDEAGRGPLAGPVVVAAVILGQAWDEPVLLEDSKRLTEEQREAAFPAIRGRALAWRVAVVSPETIDRINILQATLQGMAQAVKRLNPPPQYVLVDGNRWPEMTVPGEAIVRGDARSCTIAAASIVAKVVRDRLMRVYGRRYPQWGFERHKGYGTAAHRKAMERHGLSPIHRRSFRVKGLPWPAKANWEAGARKLPLATWSA